MNSIPDDHPYIREIEKHLLALPDAVTQDFARSSEIYLANPDDPFARRLLVKAVISYIEGNMAVIRQQLSFFYHFITDSELSEAVPEATELAEKLNFDFRVKDYMSLIGKRYDDLKRQDSEIIRDEILCVEKTIKLLFKLHGQVYGHSIMPVDEADGWEALMEVKQKRNQITHPKCAADLEVTTEQTHKAMAVHIWMQGYLEKIQEVQNAKWKVIYDEFTGKN